MKKQILTACVFAFGLFIPIHGQQQSKPKDEVVKITTNVVQVDVVVTDKEGKQVSDLRPEDFEVLEDGRKQIITNFSFISTSESGPVTATQNPADQASKKNAATVAPAFLRQEQVRRTIALVVDDLGLSFESIGFVRQALKKFVDEEMQPNDVVAIILTSAGAGSLQQFTSDKQRLYASIEHVRWYPNGRGDLSPFPVRNETQTAADFEMTQQVINEFEEQREANYAIGTFGSLGFVLRGLSRMPGRKSLVLVSEAFRLFTAQGRNVQLIDAMRRLTDQANQSSTVIYTIDASGLQTLTLDASDKVKGPGYLFDPRIMGSPLAPAQARRETSRVDQSLAEQAERDSHDAFRKLNAMADQRRTENIEAQTVLSFLAQQTGGIAVRNRNDLGSGLQQILEDQKGYYLLGYRPETPGVDPAIGRRRFHHLEVKIKRSGLHTRARSGYYGITDEEKAPRQLTGDELLAAALASVVAADGVHLRLTTLFANQASRGPAIRSLLHIDSHDLTFTEESDKSHKVTMDVVAVTFADNGRVLDQFAQTQSLNIDPGAYERVLQEGLIYAFDVPIKQPGAYQLRIAVRDVTSGRVGAAGQFVEVPDLNKNRLALSGITLNGTLALNKSADGAKTSAPADAGQQAGPAVRRLRQGMILNYGYTIYSARVDSVNRPQLQTQMRLFRDGKPVFTGKVLPFNLGQQTDLKRLDAGGRIIIGPDLLPGMYVLRVVVTDMLAKDSFWTATQWIDFEISN